MANVDRAEKITRKALERAPLGGVVRVVRGSHEQPILEVSSRIRPDESFAIASISKLFTAAATHETIARGLLALDTAVISFLPAQVSDHLSQRPSCELLTVRDLLTHRSGFADAYVDGPEPLKDRALREDFAFSLTDMTAWTMNLGSVKPGKRGHYADINYDLLGAVLANVHGRPLTDVISELIFEPAGMSMTVFADADGPVPEIGHKGAGLARPKFLSSSGASGGGISTVHDLDRFLRSYLGAGSLKTPSVNSEDLTKLQLAMGPLRYGIGFMETRVNPPIGKKVMRGHIGSTGSFAFYVPDSETTITGTLNTFGQGPTATRLAMRLAAMLG